MDRRQVIKRSAMMVGTSVALAGCTAGGESEDAEGTDSVAKTDQSEDEPEEDKPEPEGGDGKPHTHYDLDIIEEQSKTNPSE